MLDPDYLIEAIQENFQPEEVFTEEQLGTWAEANGFKKSEE